MSAITHTTVQAAAPGRVRSRAFRQMLRTEAKLFLREPLGLFWGVLFPLVLTLVFGLAGGSKHQKDLGGQTLIDVYVPVMMAFVLTILAVNMLPAILSTYREKGVLRRLSTTPVKPRLLLGADAAITIGVILTAMTVIVVVSKVAFHVSLPREVVGFIVTLVLTMVAVLALGTVVGSVAPTTRIAQGISTILFFPMMFFAGLWVPQQQMSTTLRDISHLTPLGAASSAIQQTMQGDWPSASHLIVLASYAIALSIAASRLFRWE